MVHQPLKVLFIAEQCNPEWPSVPLEGYQYFRSIAQQPDVELTLVTHERNQAALTKVAARNVVYISESSFSKQYHALIASLTTRGTINWPLYHALAYPIYAEFNRRVFRAFKSAILQGQYDIIHAITPMMPRYPYKVVQVCQKIPFLLGPVNGGVPFPPGFAQVARREFAGFNFLRAVGRRLIPGYIETYKKADQILAGSTYTLQLLKQLFGIPDQRIRLFYENGIPASFFDAVEPIKHQEDIVRVLFVGRLVPYKCADLVLTAISQLTPAIRERVHLTIVGDGSERQPLSAQATTLGLSAQVYFAGWVPQSETLQYYREADIFCFPSVREFGGAVVLEAMACGLPCIVADNGGIGEYVTAATGFKIEPRSPEYLTQELTAKLQLLAGDPALRQQMSIEARIRAKAFVWEHKAEEIVQIYQELVNRTRV